MAPTLRDLVAWTVQDTPPEVAAWQAVSDALNAAWVVGTLGAAATGAPGRASFALPADPDAYLDLGVVQLTGSSSWLPPARRHRVAATRRDAWVDPGRDTRPPARVPLEVLRVAAAAPVRRSRAPRHARAAWVLTLLDDEGARLRLSGAWLALAWIGHLAGWPEPGAGPDRAGG